MLFLFDELIYRPVYNLLVFIYNTLPFADFGVAIILVTVIIKFLLIPLSKKQIQSQKKLQEIQPKIKEIQKKYKNDKEKQTRATMEFYKQNKINPFSGCLPVIFQLVFLIAIYRVLFNISSGGLRVDQNDLYFFVSDPGQIKEYFLGLVSLSSSINFSEITLKNIPHIILVVMAAGAQYFQTKMLMAKNVLSGGVKKGDSSEEPDFSQIMTKQMLYIGPLLTLFIGIKFAAGLSLYWLVSTLFAIAQQKYIENQEKTKESLKKA